MLPAGTYYISSNAYYEGGGYTITRAASAATVQTAQAGINQTAIPRNATTTLRFAVRTPSRVEFDVVQGSNFDAQLGVIDAFTGLGMAWEGDENMGPEDCNLGMHLPVGDYFLFIRDYGGVAGNSDVRVLPPLQRWVGDNLMALGHGGSPLYFLLSTKGAAPSNPLPGILTGNLLLDLPAAIIVPFTMPVTGMIDFKASMPPNSGLFLQMVEVDSTGLRGVYSNLLK